MSTIEALQLVKTEEHVYHLRLPANAGGHRLLLRHVIPADKECLQQGFEQLSPASRRLRFLTNMRRLPEQYLSYLTEIDNINHLAWGAKDLDHHLQGAGISRYIRLPEEPKTAEFAVTVLDTYQQKGIGRVLLALLIHSALEHGIYHFRGFLNRDNAAIQALLQPYQPVFRRDHGTILRVEIKLKAATVSWLH